MPLESPRATVPSLYTFFGDITALWGFRKVPDKFGYYSSAFDFSSVFGRATHGINTVQPDMILSIYCSNGQELSDGISGEAYMVVGQTCSSGGTEHIVETASPTEAWSVLYPVDKLAHVLDLLGRRIQKATGNNPFQSIRHDTIQLAVEIFDHFGLPTEPSFWQMMKSLEEPLPPQMQRAIPETELMDLDDHQF